MNWAPGEVLWWRGGKERTQISVQIRQVHEKADYLPTLAELAFTFALPVVISARSCRKASSKMTGVRRGSRKCRTGPDRMEPRGGVGDAEAA